MLFQGVELLKLKLMWFRVWAVVARLVFGRRLKKAVLVARVSGPDSEKSGKHRGSLSPKL